MLSTQNPSLYPQHQRTNSAPTTRQVAPMVSILPATPIQQIGNHRRGLTIDESMHGQFPQLEPKQDNGPVYTNNYGPQAQYMIRETQQQAMARPGQHSIPQSKDSVHSEYSHILTPRALITPHFSDNFSDLDSPRTNSFSGHPNQIEQYEPFQYDLPNLTEPTSATFSECFDDGTKKHTENVADNGMDELKQILGIGSTSEEPLHQQATASVQRPFTPLNQSSTTCFPLTPAATPFTQSSKSQKKSMSRTTQSSPVRRGPIGTTMGLQAQTMKRGSSCQDAFSATGLKTNEQNIPSPPHTVQLPCSRFFDISPIPPPSFMNMTTLKMNFNAQSTGYDSSNYSPMSNRVSPAISSFHTSPEPTHLNLFPELDVDTQKPTEQLSQVTGFSNLPELQDISFSVEEESSSRAQSFSGVANEPIDGTMVDTGITSDEIAAFIGGPDATTNKYVCLYPRCQKLFGRKENVKAHVQTHLGDRQFVCNVCSKQFVRQHDLKRHAKIHSGATPFICLCTSQFGREDALTRHRQRNNCCGGIGGATKKETKRGRPRKNNRPDTAERTEKAARTRQRVLEKKAYASSQSGSSEYSLPSPPPLYEDTDMRGSSPFDSVPDMEPMSYDVFSSLLSDTPADSPGYSTGMAPQLSGLSNASSVAINSPSPKRGRSITSAFQEDTEEYTLPGSPSKSIFSQYGTPAQPRTILADAEDEFSRKLQQYQASFEEAFAVDDKESSLPDNNLQSTWKLDDFINPWDDDLPNF